MDRFNGDLTMHDMKNNAKIVQFLVKRTNERAWTHKSLVQNKVKTRQLEKSDFSKIKVSLLNLAQHKECITSKR